MQRNRKVIPAPPTIHDPDESLHNAYGTVFPISDRVEGNSNTHQEKWNDVHMEMRVKKQNRILLETQETKQKNDFKKFEQNTVSPRFYQPPSLSTLWVSITSVNSDAVTFRLPYKFCSVLSTPIQFLSTNFFLLIPSLPHSLMETACKKSKKQSCEKRNAMIHH